MMCHAVFRDRFLLIDNNKCSIMLIMDQALFIRYVDINVKKKNSLKPHIHM